MSWELAGIFFLCVSSKWEGGGGGGGTTSHPFDPHGSALANRSSHDNYYSQLFEIKFGNNIRSKRKEVFIIL